MISKSTLSRVEGVVVRVVLRVVLWRAHTGMWCQSVRK